VVCRADVIGRRQFDMTNGWNGRPVVGDAVFVVTHQPPTVFGAGVRVLRYYAGSPLLLDDPQIVQGDGVTHLHYRLRKS
jgi:hypothetical protein